MFDVVFHFGLLLSLTPLGSLWMPGLQRRLHTSFTLNAFHFSGALLYNHSKEKGNEGVSTDCNVPCCGGLFAGHQSFCTFFHLFVVQFEVSYMHSVTN